MYLAALLIDDSTATASRPALSRDALSCNTTASSYSRFILWNAVSARWLMRAAGKTDCDATVTCLSTVLAVHCMIPSSPITPSTIAMTLVFIGPESVSRDCGGRVCIPCIGWHSFWVGARTASEFTRSGSSSGWLWLEAQADFAGLWKSLTCAMRGHSPLRNLCPLLLRRVPTLLVRLLLVTETSALNLVQFSIPDSSTRSLWAGRLAIEEARSRRARVLK